MWLIKDKLKSSSNRKRQSKLKKNTFPSIDHFARCKQNWNRKCFWTSVVYILWNG